MRCGLSETFLSFQDSLFRMENFSLSPFLTPPTPGPEKFTPPAPPDPSQGIERTLYLLSIVVYGVACLLGVTGNGLVIWIAGFKMEKTVNVVWFLNLALADFVFTFFLPLSIAYTALGFHWPFGRFLCKLNSSLAFLNMFASVFLLTVISLDRCLLVVLPVWSRNHRTPRLAWAIALVTWGAALLISSPYFVFRDTALNARNATSCYNNFALSSNYTSQRSRDLWRKRHRAMILARFVFGFLLPFTVIAVCHAVVAFQLQRRRLAKSPKPLRIIAAVTASFFLCYSPYHVLSLLELSKMSGSPAVKRVLHLGVPLASSLAFFNSCLNPLLYVFVGQKSFRRSVWGAFEGAFGEEALLSLSSKRKSRAVSQTEIRMA
ncbi:PREDICTED: chemokine-like receptor 1 [Thamnophis sirtalis]|uniref:Chemokine-like receptor 1 n=1 Tax=Thamnophis sirtalis TaxID=35019 RepID=A0A6I9YR94_9SAUR|nr:PREDICTED: chemokine-like receptor 1 [Thamnophis sirtalis]